MSTQRTTPRAASHFSPANALLDAVRELGAEVHEGTPARALFPRWYRDGSALWLESSAGSLLLTVDFVSETVRVPQWKVERDGLEPVRPMPEAWRELYLGSLFDAEGAALHPDKFAAASAAWGS